jgi:hypothetical protein
MAPIKVLKGNNFIVLYAKDKLKKTDHVRKTNNVGYSRNHHRHGNATVLSSCIVVYYVSYM